MHIFFYVHAANDNKYLFYDTLGRSKGEVGERQDFSFFDLPKSCTKGVFSAFYVTSAYSLQAPCVEIRKLDHLCGHPAGFLWGTYEDLSTTCTPPMNASLCRWHSCGIRKGPVITPH